ncbi:MULTISPECIES: hypothetical protein [unclassified Burkholderia]|uniref:hypothetical protein n=1 Tax=unclassified Burkholderia TaxID=2613784 RepID=UPI0007580B97|nr:MULTISPECIES: hypothetical protein [unclassified Burkholderia]KVK87997.1 hypothetical protein WS91_30355 [Burkholderia sp. MSMB1498]
MFLNAALRRADYLEYAAIRRGAITEARADDLNERRGANGVRRLPESMAEAAPRRGAAVPLTLDRPRGRFDAPAHRTDRLRARRCQSFVRLPGLLKSARISAPTTNGSVHEFGQLGGIV